MHSMRTFESQLEEPETEEPEQADSTTISRMMTTLTTLRMEVVLEEQASRVLQ